MLVFSDYLLTVLLPVFSFVHGLFGDSDGEHRDRNIFSNFGVLQGQGIAVIDHQLLVSGNVGVKIL